jgi:glycosyltransferase involved in cell wall biosynthesis
MKLLYLVSAGGAAMRRSVRAALVTAAPLHELRMLAPDAEAKSLRDLGIPTESWRPAGLFNVLRAINVLRRAVDRYEPVAIHAFGWTAAAVALGALPTRYARRTLVTLQDPIRKNEMPKTFIEKRLPELLARSWHVACAYETLRRVLVDSLAVPAEKVAVVPYGVTPVVPADVFRAPGRAGPRIGYYGRLESDRAWEIAVDAYALIRRNEPAAELVFGRTGPIAGLVRAHARSAGVGDGAVFRLDAELADFCAEIDLLLVPGAYDGLPYAVVEALVNGIPLIAADAGGIADTASPYAGWLVPDNARGFAAGIEEAWNDIDAAWSAAHAQRPASAASFSAEIRSRALLAQYEQMAREPASSPTVSVEVGHSAG